MDLGGVMLQKAAGQTCVLAERRGSPERFSNVGIDGPKISVSRIPLRRPCRANARARLTVSRIHELDRSQR